jgi:hypothetical protein
MGRPSQRDLPAAEPQGSGISQRNVREVSCLRPAARLDVRLRFYPIHLGLSRWLIVCRWHLGMFMEKYTPMGRGFDEHMGYYQGCESAYTHIAACCKAGSPDSDQDFVCQPGRWSANYTHSAPKDYRGYDWFKSGWPNHGVSKPDLSVNHTNSATLITEAAVEFLGRMKSATRPFFLYLPFQNIHGAPSSRRPASVVPTCTRRRRSHGLCLSPELCAAVGPVCQGPTRAMPSTGSSTTRRSLPRGSRRCLATSRSSTPRWEPSCRHWRVRGSTTTPSSSFLLSARQQNPQIHVRIWCRPVYG